jgi:hypothetical protein
MMNAMRIDRGLLLALLVTASCGGSSGAIQKELAEIRQDLVKLRVQNIILTERLDSLDAARRPPAASAASAAGDPDRPSLEVVRLSPEAPGKAQPGAAGEPAAGSHAQEPPDQGDPKGSADPLAGPRPVLRMTGKGSPSTVPAQKKDPLKPNARP